MILPSLNIVHLSTGIASAFAFLGCSLVFIAIAATFVAAAGFKKIPIGAKGVVISMGRRTGNIKDEGTTWLMPFVNEIKVIYTRERQIDIPQAEYYTSDRAKISFKTTLRITVSDPAALFDQGPGTYEPFTRDGRSSVEDGASEKHVALRELMRNAIRESVASMGIHDVMFGGHAAKALCQQIRQELMRTAERWGFHVVDVWVTQVEADSAQLKDAVESEVRESFSGQGKLAAHQAEISKGALFVTVASRMADDMREQFGMELSAGEALQFLTSNYQNERALDVALKSAHNTSDFARRVYMQIGPKSEAPGQFPVSFASPHQLASSFQTAEAQALVPADGSWIVGREGDIGLDWDGVSRHHARIDVVNGQMILTDLGSTNGTYVNDTQLPANVPTRVDDNATVWFGKNVSFSASQIAQATLNRRLASDPSG